MSNEKRSGPGGRAPSDVSGGARRALRAPTETAAAGHGAGAVNYTLFARRRIGEEIDRLVSGNLTEAELDDHVARLARMGPGVVAILAEKLRRSVFPEAAVYAGLICELAGEQARPVLLGVLRDATVADREKLIVLREMDEAGLDTDDLPLDEWLSDPRAAVRESLDAVLSAVAGDERAMAEWFRDGEDGPADPEFVLFQVESLAERSDARAAPLLHLWSRYPSEAVQAVAIDALARIGNGRALTALTELAGRAVNRGLRRAAQQAAERLARRGVKAVEHRPAEAVGPIDRIYVSSIDGAGSRVLCVVRKRPSGRDPFTDVHVLLNTRVGIKDMFGRHDLPAGEVRGTVSSLREDGTRVVAVDAAHAGKLFRDGLATARKAGTALPLAYCYWQDFLPPDWLHPEPHEPELDAAESDPEQRAASAARRPSRGSPGRSPGRRRADQGQGRRAESRDVQLTMDDVEGARPIAGDMQPAGGPQASLDAEPADAAADPSFGKAAARLPGLPDLESWYFEDPLVYDAAERLQQLSGVRGRRRGKRPEPADDARRALFAGLGSPDRDQVDAIIASLYERLVLPGLPELARRTALAAELLRIDGAREAHTASRVALDLRRLHEGGAEPMELARHPFLVTLVTRSLVVAADNMAEGIDPRINPEVFA